MSKPHAHLQTMTKTFGKFKKRLASRKLLRIKVTPDLHLTYSKHGGKPGVGIENEKYSLSVSHFY